MHHQDIIINQPTHQIIVTLFLQIVQYSLAHQQSTSNLNSCPKHAIFSEYVCIICLTTFEGGEKRGKEKEDVGFVFGLLESVWNKLILLQPIGIILLLVTLSSFLSQFLHYIVRLDKRNKQICRQNFKNFTKKGKNLKKIMGVLQSLEEKEKKMCVKL